MFENDKKRKLVNVLQKHKKPKPILTSFKKVFCGIFKGKKSLKTTFEGMLLLLVSNEKRGLAGNNFNR